MTEKDKQLAENLKALLPRLSEQDKQIFMAYGEGMASKAARTIYTTDAAPRPERRT